MNVKGRGLSYLYQYTRLDSEIEARLDYFSSNLSVFENRSLRLPSEMAINRNFLKPKSLFSIKAPAGPILRLRFGDFILLSADGKVLAFVEFKSIIMRKDEGVFDEKFLDDLFGHSIDNIYAPCVDRVNVCASDEKGAKFLSKDLLTKHTTKAYAEEVLEKPLVGSRLYEQLYEGRKLLDDPRKSEEVKIHALGKVTSKVEKSDL